MWVTQPGDRPSLAEPTGMGEGGRGCANREQLMPIKGWLLPGLGSGHARVTGVFSAEQYFLGEGRTALPLA